MTPLQRDIMLILQARTRQTEDVVDLETLETIFLDTHTERPVILAALEQLVRRGLVKENGGRWILSAEDGSHSHMPG